MKIVLVRNAAVAEASLGFFFCTKPKLCKHANHLCSRRRTPPPVLGKANAPFRSLGLRSAVRRGPRVPFLARDARGLLCSLHLRQLHLSRQAGAKRKAEDGAERPLSRDG